MPSHPDRVRRNYTERPAMVITDEGFTANVIEGDDFYTKQAIEAQLTDTVEGYPRLGALPCDPEYRVHYMRADGNGCSCGEWKKAAQIEAQLADCEPFEQGRDLGDETR